MIFSRYKTFDLVLEKKYRLFVLYDFFRQTSFDFLTTNLKNITALGLTLKKVTTY